MEKDKIIALFKNIGLSENEARVYFAMLSVGPSPIMKIARAAGVKRTTVYPVIETLKNRGLARVEQPGLKQKFAAEDPSKLEAVIDAQQREFKNAIPSLRSLYFSDESATTVKYYQGLKAIKGIYDDLLAGLKPGDFYLAISNIQNWQGLDETFFMKHVEDRAHLRVKTRLLFQDSETARNRKKTERNFNEEIRILPESTHLETDLAITPRKMVIFQLREPLVAIVIENKTAIEMQKELFEIIWKSSSATI